MRPEICGVIAKAALRAPWTLAALSAGCFISYECLFKIKVMFARKVGVKSKQNRDLNLVLSFLHFAAFRISSKMTMCYQVTKLKWKTSQ